MRNQALTDVQTTLSGNALLPQSIMRVLATTEAGLAYELYAFLDYISLQSVPYTAQGEFLEAWANLKGVYRLDATAATGTITFTGTAGTDVPVGTIVATDNNVQYVTNADYVVGRSAPVSFTAVVLGSAGNAAIGTALTLTGPIIGVSSTTSAATAIVGGSDQELDDAFRSRMLAVYQSPPNGGSASDFAEWALQVPGCSRAWVVGQGIGTGTVLVYVMFDAAESVFNGFPQGTNGGATAETRITAATGDQLLVANYIYPLRPVTSLVQVSAPTAAPINFSIQALSPTSSTIQAAISAALIDLFVRLGSPLAGNIIYPSDVNAAIESAAGVGVYTLISPVTPITVATGSLPTLGTITWS